MFDYTDDEQPHAAIKGSARTSFLRNDPIIGERACVYTARYLPHRQTGEKRFVGLNFSFN